MVSDIKHIIFSMRAKQWIKNVFIFTGLIFSLNLFNIHLLAKVFAGFILFSLGASSIYIFNDIQDIKKDRDHPEKCKRPLASGSLRVTKAYAASLVLAVISLVGAFLVDQMFFAILAAYIVMNTAYSIKIKHLVILDVMCIAFGFVFRVLAGSELAGVSPSDWLIICTITLSLFLGFSKRRQELALVGADATNHRRVLTDYSIAFLDQMIAVATACTVMSYALYTIADETVARFGTRNLVFTIPFVIYGIYRYLYLIHRKEMGGNPTKALVSDPALVLNGILWLGAVIFIVYSCEARYPREELYAEYSLSADEVPLYGIQEFTFEHNGAYSNPFFDLNVEVVLKSPSGYKQIIKGFFYKDKIWKVRFRPNNIGLWTFSYNLIGKNGFKKHGDGSFYCIENEENGLGPIKPNPKNMHRWIFADGTPYFPIGLQTGFRVKGSKIYLEHFWESEDRKGTNAKFMSGLDQYFGLFSRAGFNLLRFSQRNDTYVLYKDLDTYSIEEGLATDELLQQANRYGLHVMFGIFGYHANWTEGNRYIRALRGRLLYRLLGINQEAINNPDDQETIAKEKRFIEYCVARWGVYVDFWELLNERKASDQWVTQMAEYLHSIDPDRKPVTTSWEKPRLKAIDINAPHWYESETEFESDLRVLQQAQEWKQAGKPVIVGEHGNTGMNWDKLSGRRMRIRAWTALFQEIVLVFWETTWSKKGMFQGIITPGGVANIYLGTEEREYIRILQNFSTKLDSDVKMVSIDTSAPEVVRAYSLQSDKVYAVYLHHFENHSSLVNNVKLLMALPDDIGLNSHVEGEWIDPATGTVLETFTFFHRNKVIDVPPFTIDLALIAHINNS